MCSFVDSGERCIRGSLQSKGTCEYSKVEAETELSRIILIHTGVECMAEKEASNDKFSLQKAATRMHAILVHLLVLRYELPRSNMPDEAAATCVRSTVGLPLCPLGNRVFLIHRAASCGDIKSASPLKEGLLPRLLMYSCGVLMERLAEAMRNVSESETCSPICKLKRLAAALCLSPTCNTSMRSTFQNIWRERFAG